MASDESADNLQLEAEEPGVAGTGEPGVAGTEEAGMAGTEGPGAVGGRMPAIYLGHGAPPLVDDGLWVSQLAGWAVRMPKPRSILVVSAHWESAPLTLGATTTMPLVYDFWGFPQHYYQTTYPAPGAPELARRVEALMPAGSPVVHQPDRGLDHGAYVPLTVMYPDADVPVLQMSLPTMDPTGLLDLGRRLAPLRDEGVLIIGSGFLTHGLPYLRMQSPGQSPPGWSAEFDAWAAEALAGGDLEQLVDFSHRAPAARYAHPTVEHLAPLFVTLGVAEKPEAALETVIDGYWFGLAKRSIQVA
jgi:4,5-DOPA dioxygenase extradiol